MNKIPILLLMPALLYAAPLWAEDPPDGRPYLSAQRALSVNRSLLTRTEDEYRRLSEEQAKNPSNETAESLTALQYKIKALRDDAKRLQSELPKNARAAEFLKDLTGHAPLDLEREKSLNEKLESVYALHEKALALVAQKKYAEAARVYEDVILESADDDEAYLLLGHTQLLSGEYEKAGQAFMNAVYINPANASEIPRFYGNILMENPQDDAAYAHLGFAYWTLGEKDAAKEAFEAALEINPQNAEANAALSRIRAASVQ